MCLGIPAKIIAIKNKETGIAEADIGGIKRDINVALLELKGLGEEQLIGRYVLLHVGFAMALVDEEEAQKTLSLLNDLDGQIEEDSRVEKKKVVSKNHE